MFQFLLVQLVDPMITKMITGKNVSIPSGSISRAQKKELPKITGLFQFLLVQLVASLICSHALLALVSIPSGSISRILGNITTDTK